MIWAKNVLREGDADATLARAESVLSDPHHEDDKYGFGGPEDELVQTSLNARVTTSPVELMHNGKLTDLAGPQEKLLSLTPTERLEAIKPISWLHVPKSGSSFANFLIDLPGNCPGVPLDVVIDEKTFGGNQQPGEFRKDQQLGKFRKQYDPLGKGCNDVTSGISVHDASKATGPAVRKKTFLKWGNHQGLGWTLLADPRMRAGTASAVWKGRYWHHFGHTMTMLRDPVQRIISGYYHNFHSWFDFSHNPANITEYAEKLKGCAVKLIVRAGDNEVCGGPRVSPKEFELARMRLREFVFVGLTDEWELSMCLGHKMFGGACRGSDFVHSRVGRKRGQKSLARDYNVTKAGLEGFVDEYDARLLAEAQRIFQRELELYNVTSESCEPCFREAGIAV